MESEKDNLLAQQSHWYNIWTTGSAGCGLLLHGSDFEDLSEFKLVETQKSFGEPLQVQAIEIGGTIGSCLAHPNRVFVFGESIQTKSHDASTIRPRELHLGINVLKISCGWAHALFLDASRTRVFGFGANNFGELGEISLTTRAATATAATREGKRQPFIQEPQEIFLNQCDTIVDIKCGFRQSFIACTKKDKRDTILCSGSNRSNEFAGSITDPVVYSFTDNEKLVEQLNGIPTKIISGCKFTCAITQDGQLFGWGENKFRQIIDNPEKKISQPTMIINEVKDADAGWNHILVWKKNDEIVCFGRGDLGQLGKIDDLGQITTLPSSNVSGIEGKIERIACGSEANYVKTEHSLYVWGWNEHGNLGINSTTNAVTPSKVQSLPEFSEIRAAGATVYILQHISIHQKEENSNQ